MSSSSEKQATGPGLLKEFKYRNKIGKIVVKAVPYSVT
jgi:hypothetical protein